MIFHSQLSLGSELPDLIITRQIIGQLVYDSSTHLYRNLSILILLMIMGIIADIMSKL
jgi:hypothetical protein